MGWDAVLDAPFDSTPREYVLAQRARDNKGGKTRLPRLLASRRATEMMTRSAGWLGTSMARFSSQISGVVVRERSRASVNVGRKREEAR